MTLRVNPEFAALLAVAATTNNSWSSAFKSGLGANRRVICKRSADSTTPQADVYANGATFRDAALTGAMTINGGIVTNYGVTSNLTVSQPADISTGISILRIEGNGNWIEGTLGLVGSNCDFVFPVNPTTTNSIAVSPNMRITPPPFLPSGTGYPPPSLDVDAPAYVVVENWIGGSYVGEAGRIPFDTRIQNWTFEDAEVALSMGDVRVTQSTQMVTLGDIEIGNMLLSQDARVGSIAGKVKHTAMAALKPTETNWPGYPRPNGATLGGYRQGTRTINGNDVLYGISNTFPSAFKMRVMTADDRLLGYMHEARDNSAVNAEDWSEVPTNTKPLRLRMHCASMLVWESHPAITSTYAKKYFSGIAPEFMRPSQMKGQSNANGVYPPFKFPQMDGVGQWHAAPKYSYPANATSDAAADATLDPYLYKPTNGYSTFGWASWFGVQPSEFGTAKSVANMMQFGYEPGAWCMHDQFSGPGGYRIDRAIIADPIAIYFTDPTWVHLHTGTPISEMIRHWNKGYFNHAIHHFTDVRTFAGLPTQEVCDGLWANYQQYYNSGALFTGIDHAVQKFVFPGGATEHADRPHWGALVDTNYRMPYNGFSADVLHNYTSPGWTALLFNSVAHAVSQKFRYFEHIQCQMGGTRADMSWGELGVRSHAWILFHEGMMWKLASDHPLGVSRAQVEKRIEDLLNSLYTNVTLPVYVNNDQSMVSRCLRNLGIKVEWTTDYGACWYPRSFTLHYYMAHALVTWRQFGLLKVMMARSESCKQAILTIFKMLDKGCIDYYLDTDGCYSGPVYNAGVNLWVGNRFVHDENIEVATSWADWLARVNPKASALEDLVHNADGSLRGDNNTRGVDIGEWSRLQWPFIRRDFFPDIPCDRDVNACCNKITAWMQVYTNRINGLIASNAPKLTIANAEPAVHPALGRLLPPPTLEPI